MDITRRTSPYTAQNWSSFGHSVTSWPSLSQSAHHLSGSATTVPLGGTSEELTLKGGGAGAAGAFPGDFVGVRGYRVRSEEGGKLRSPSITASLPPRLPVSCPLELLPMAEQFRMSWPPVSQISHQRTL